MPVLETTLISKAALAQPVVILLGTVGVVAYYELQHSVGTHYGAHAAAADIKASSLGYSWVATSHRNNSLFADFSETITESTSNSPAVLRSIPVRVFRCIQRTRYSRALGKAQSILR